MTSTHSLVPVLMCGGSGTRLWPLSRSSAPKQFVALAGARSLLQETCARIAPHADGRWIAVSNVDHRFLVAEQLRDEGVTNATILLEPVARNTAPAIAVAALEAIARADGDDPILVVLPSDHVIADSAAFGRALAPAHAAAAGGALVTFGVVPTTPATGYGYIRAGHEESDARGPGRRDGGPLDAGPTGPAGPAPADPSPTVRPDAAEALPVVQFVEKPDAETAAAYLASGDYFWNSGMFVFRAGRYLEELGRHRPEMLELCRRAFADRVADSDFTRLAGDPFEAIRPESIDYAVMEHTDRAVVVALDAGWSDVGSWDALWELADRDAAGNATWGDVLALDTRGSYLRSQGRRLVATVGMDDLVVVDTPDAVLIAPRARAQDVAAIAGRLRADGREEAELPARVLRPWGDYESLDVGPMYQVKRITVKPGAKLSIQKHRHRAEHWTVVRGVGRVLRDEEIFDLQENESAFLPLGCVHRLENPGTEPLILIEVQYGDYLGEDDIIRFEDEYGRDIG